jgi:hypothetical protein
MPRGGAGKGINGSPTSFDFQPLSRLRDGFVFLFAILLPMNIGETIEYQP